MQKTCASQDIALAGSLPVISWPIAFSHEIEAS